jgi:uncharacterized protein (UPF0333 family)
MELMMLWAVVIVALIYMMAFFGRHVKGNVMNQAKTVSGEPWGESAAYTSNSNSDSFTVSNSLGSEVNSNSNTNTDLNLNAVE